MSIPVLDRVGTVQERAAAVAAVAAEHAADVDAAGRLPAEAIAALRDAGLLGASAPRELGGEGLTLTELADITSALGAACSSTAMVFAMHHSQLLSLTRHLAESASLAELVRRITAEQLLIASATTEIGIGGDVRSSSCFVDRRDGDVVHLVKNAPVISYGADADLILVTARANADSAPSDQVLVACDRASTALERTGTWDTLGLRGTSSFGYQLSAVVTADRIVPQPYEAISTETMLPVSHTLWAAAWLGMARSVVDTSRHYVRAAARRSIGSLPAGAPTLVGLVAELEGFEALVAGAARRFDELSEDRDALGAVGFLVSMNNLKVTASTLVAEIAQRALAITGISGYRNDGQYSVARVFRDAQGAALMVHNDRIIANSAQLMLVQKGVGTMTLVADIDRTEALAAARIAFRDDLLAAGILVGTSVPGIYGRSGAFESIVTGLDRLLGEMAAPLNATVLRFPPVYPRVDFERTDYIASFPDLSGIVSSFDRGDREHRELLAAREAGEPYESWLTPADVVLTNAICHPLYATLEGRLPEGGSYFDLSGYGFRHEPSLDPMRMQSFRMREFVFAGTPDDAQNYRDEWLDRAVETLASLGLAVDAVPATDPFFGRAGKMLVSAQLRENLKVEIVVPLYGDLSEGTAIASANCQREHLTAAFGILTADGQQAHGACVAFGMERVSLALLRTHGLSLAAWPTDVRALLGI